PGVPIPDPQRHLTSTIGSPSLLLLPLPPSSPLTPLLLLSLSLFPPKSPTLTPTPILQVSSSTYLESETRNMLPYSTSAVTGSAPTYPHPIRSTGLKQRCLSAVCARYCPRQR
ncbi:hypothetical protein FRC08_006514, partial [Ceratobasidium sp. 394]